MVVMLNIIGFLSIAIYTIVGFTTRSGISILGYIIVGCAIGLIFFALAKILDNQAQIMQRIDNQEERLRRYNSREKKICPECNKTYKEICNSCPHCGYREK